MISRSTPGECFAAGCLQAEAVGYRLHLHIVGDDEAGEMQILAEQSADGRAGQGCRVNRIEIPVKKMANHNRLGMSSIDQ